MPIDEWKRQYSNNDTDVALKWFWEHYNPKDYSLWRVDYKVPQPYSPPFRDLRHPFICVRIEIDLFSTPRTSVSSSKPQT